MSKRLSKGACRVFDINTREVKVVPGEITKGQALIRARGILGPDGFVSVVIGEFPCVFVRKPSGETYLAGAGPAWESALAGAAASEYAVDWSDKQVEIGNEIEAALDSLKKTRKEIAETNFKQFMQGLVDRAQRREEDKRKNAENYELWKEARAEETVTAIARSRARAMIGPHVQFLELANLKALAKAERVREYDQVHQGF